MTVGPFRPPREGVASIEYVFTGNGGNGKRKSPVKGTNWSLLTLSEAESLECRSCCLLCSTATMLAFQMYTGCPEIMESREVPEFGPTRFRKAS